MSVRIHQESPDALLDYARIPIAFEAGSVMVPTGSGPNHDLALTERPLAAAFRKDYDAIPNEEPASWRRQFDLSHWVFFGAFANDERVGGAAVVMRAPDIDLLEGRGDLGLLWDIRVAPEARRSGIGGALLDAVERWSRDQDAHWLKVETQNTNVAACRFYARHGFALRTVNPQAYPALPNEM